MDAYQTPLLQMNHLPSGLRGGQSRVCDMYFAEELSRTCEHLSKAWITEEIWRVRSQNQMPPSSTSHRQHHNHAFTNPSELFRLEVPAERRGPVDLVVDVQSPSTTSRAFSSPTLSRCGKKNSAKDQDLFPHLSVARSPSGEYPLMTLPHGLDLSKRQCESLALLYTDSAYLVLP